MGTSIVSASIVRLTRKMLPVILAPMLYAQAFATNLNTLIGASKPDFVFVLNNFNALRSAAVGGSLPEVDATTTFTIGVAAFAGSFQDDGIGEDSFPNAGVTQEVTFEATEAALVIPTGEIDENYPATSTNAYKILVDGNSYDVGVPPNIGSVPGWDVKDLRLWYNHTADTLRVGVNFYGIGGDADGDGDPSSSSTALTENGGQDVPDLSLSEAILVKFDFGSAGSDTLDNQIDVIVGIPGEFDNGVRPATCDASYDVSCFNVYRPATVASAQSGAAYTSNDTLCAQVLATNLNQDLSALKPDFEFVLTDVSALRSAAVGGSLPALNETSVFSIGVAVYAGSFQDDGIGEEYFPNSGTTEVVEFSPDLFTGDTEADFAAASTNNYQIIEDTSNRDVGMPPAIGGTSGWDIKDIRLLFDGDADTLTVGVNFWGIASDADGDGDPSSSSTELTNYGGIDSPDLQYSESILVMFDFGTSSSATLDSIVDLSVGVPGSFENNAAPTDCAAANYGISCFNVFRPQIGTNGGVSYTSGDALYAQTFVTNHNSEFSATQPDVTFVLENFNALRSAAVGGSLTPVDASSTFSIGVAAYSGSYQDDGIGEDFVPNGATTEVVTFSPSA